LTLQQIDNYIVTLEGTKGKGFGLDPSQSAYLFQVLVAECYFVMLNLMRVVGFDNVLVQLSIRT